jgi:bacteriocin-like protein
MADPKDALKPEVDEIETDSTEPLSEEDLANVSGGNAKPQFKEL